MDCEWCGIRGLVIFVQKTDAKGGVLVLDCLVMKDHGKEGTRRFEEA